MDDKQKYIPISCSQYDELELLAMRKTVCQIEYLDSLGVHTKIDSIIANLVTKDKVEYLVTPDNLQIRLDKIVLINGQPIKDHC